MTTSIPEYALQQRAKWLDKIANLKGEFAQVSRELEKELIEEVKLNGYETIIHHLRLCGNIPERYHHDSTEEKQYSKYTDALLSVAFTALGYRSNVITERADVADVDVFCEKHNYSFVADAKAFRLTRTAKNQKDFKVSSMDRWKHGKPYAMVVCPLHQLPSTRSQIYSDAISKDVIVFTYSHLSAIIRFAYENRGVDPTLLLLKIFKVTQGLYESKDASNYWNEVNSVILSFHPAVKKIWKEEIQASKDSVQVGIQETLDYLSGQKEKIESLSREEAVKLLLGMSKLDSKISLV